MKEITKLLRIENAKLLEQLAILSEKQKSSDCEIERVNSSLVHLTKLNNELAAALGSCYLCWGKEPYCINCSGKGVPGWNSIDKRLFDIYILPAIRKLKG